VVKFIFKAGFLYPRVIIQFLSEIFKAGFEKMVDPGLIFCYSDAGQCLKKPHKAAKLD